MSLARFSLSGLIAALTAATVLAQPAPPPTIPDRLDLPTAIRFALDNNYSIRQARERLREQEGLILEVKSQVLPQASLDSAYNATDSDLGRFGDSDVDNSRTWSVELNLRQAVYAGGGIRAALDAQEGVREAARLELQAVINDALLDVRTRFYDVLLAREQIDVQEQNVGLLQQQLETARNRFEAGAVSNFDVLRAEVALANAQAPLIRSRNDYRIAIDELRLALGFDGRNAADASKVPEFVGTLEVEPANYDLETALNSARLTRPELQRLDRLEQAQEAGVRIEQSAYRPQLDVVGGYQVRNGVGSDRLNDSVDGWVLGLQSSWAIFDGRRTKGRVAQARSRVEQTRLSASEQELAIEVEVRRALSSLQEATELVEAARLVVQQAEEALRLADSRYVAGVATQLDVLEVRVALTEARTNQLVANYQHRVALATMRKAIGEPDGYLIE